MAFVNLLKIHHPSEFSLVLKALFDGAVEKNESYVKNGLGENFRVFSSLEDALEGLKRGHTLFVQIEKKFLNINFAQKFVNVSEYDRLNYPGCAQESLEDLVNKGIVTFL
jgi:hypothetical protein